MLKKKWLRKKREFENINFFEFERACKKSQKKKKKNLGKNFH